MQKVDKEKTRYYLAKIHILFRGNFRTQEAPEADPGAFCGLYTKISFSSVKNDISPVLFFMRTELKMT